MAPTERGQERNEESAGSPYQRLGGGALRLMIVWNRVLLESNGLETLESKPLRMLA
jgi:hypothetical protein